MKISALSKGSLCLLLCGALGSCAPFQESPFSDKILRSERNLNPLAIERLGNIETDNKVRIAVFSDSHQNYKDLDQTINAINKTENLDFVANLGDFTNSSYNLEYDQFLDSYVGLRPPAFTVIGNHDAIGAGSTIFRKVFGSSNFWFESDSYRFIFFHSANLEDPKNFDPYWLKNTVESSSKYVVIFSHVHLEDGERFLGDTAQVFNSIINHAKVRAILNGHNHVYELRDVNGTAMLQAPRVEGPQWLLLEIENNQMQIQQMSTGESVSFTLKP